MKSKMIKLLYLFIFLCSPVFFTGCSEEEKDNSNLTSEINAYFPGGLNSEFGYKGSILDTSNGANQTISYDRLSKYIGTKKIDNVEYFIQENQYIYNGQLGNVDSVYFRKGENAVYFFADISSLNDLLPDSLKQAGVKIEGDKEAVIFFKPPQGANQWSVFKVNLKVGAFTFNILDVSAQNLGEEELTLNLNSQSKTIKALKIKYTFTINLINPQNPFSQPQVINYSAFAWFAKNYGIVKFEGDDAIFNALYGTGFDLNSGSRKLTEVLYTYLIK